MNVGCNGRLCPDDAQQVITVQTEFKVFGTDANTLGSTTILVNKKRLLQPTCWLPGCNHAISIYFMAAGIEYTVEILTYQGQRIGRDFRLRRPYELYDAVNLSDGLPRGEYQIVSNLNCYPYYSDRSLRKKFRNLLFGRRIVH